MSRYPIILLLLLTLVVAAGPGYAAETTEDGPLLCAITEIAECNVWGECVEVLPEGIGLPDFIVIDLERKLLLEATGEGTRTTSIDAVAKGEGTVSFGGLDQGRGWSAVLSRGNSFLTATITGEQTGFVVYGACVPKP